MDKAFVVERQAEYTETIYGGNDPRVLIEDVEYEGRGACGDIIEAEAVE